MKKLYFIFMLAFFAFLIQETNAQTTIWSEDFPYTDGTTVGSGSPAKWTRDISGCNFGNGDHFEVRNNRIQGRDTDGEAIWYSETIDISAYSNIAVSALLSKQGNMGPNNYIRIYYSLDGGAETLFDVNGDKTGNFGTATASQTGLNGNNLGIIVRVNNNTNDKRHRFDDVIVLEPIPGDFCSDAIAIGEVTDQAFSTTNATQSGDHPGCGGGDDPYDIWYAYTPSASGIAMFDLCGSSYDSRLAIWDACGGNVLECNDDNGPACNGQNASIEMTVVAGTTYYVQVGGYNTDQGNGDISLSLAPFVSNNDCANAITVGEITDLPFTTLNTSQSGENPGCGGNTDPYDIWYAYTPSANGIAMFDLCGSAFNTRLAIWDACGGNVLDCNVNNGPACSGQQSSIEMAVVAGTTYYVQVGGRNAVQGDGDITISLIPYSTNGDCANATAIGEVTDLPFTTINQTASGADPQCGGNSPPIDIWYVYTPTANGFATVDLCGSTYDTRLAIWDACGGNLLLCNDDDNYCGNNSTQSFLSGDVTVGTTYYIQVGGYNTDVGTGDITIILTPYPSNDDCNSALAINEVTDLPFSTLTATQSGTIPNCGGGTAPYDVWYAYTSTITGLATFDLCGSGFNTRLAIWDACGGNVLDCNNNNGPACPGQQSSIEMLVASGTTYYVQVGGRQANQGNGDLSISVLDIGGSDDCANAVAINEVTDYSFSTVYATASGANPGCGGGIDPVDLWFAYTATQSGLASFDLCGSAFDTRLAIWDACGGTALVCNDDDGPTCTGLQSSIEMDVNIGTTYYVQVGGYNDATGDGDLTIFVSQDVQYTLNFDGNDDYVEVPYSADLNPDQFTIECWVRAIDSEGTYRSVITSRDDNPQRGYIIYAGSNNRWQFWTGDGPGGSVSWNVLQGPSISNYVWTHIAATFDGSDMNLYVNGILEGTLTSVDFGKNETQPLRIGAGETESTTPNFFFNGTIDEVRIWNTVRTQQEIRNDMYRELEYPSSETNLNAYYQFNQNSGNILPDESPNSHSGTLHNMIFPFGWYVSTAPIPYFTIQDGDWTTWDTWGAGQLPPVSDWSRVIINNSIIQNQDQGFYSLYVNSGASLQVDPGNSILMDGDIMNFAGTTGLVFKADDTGMSSLVHNTTGIEATFEEYLSEQQWHYVSSPISNATIETYFDIYLMQYDEPTDDWTYMVNPVTTPLNVGHGYAAWASNALTGNTTVSYEGTLNTSDITYSSIEYTPASTNTGYNLIGNPYPSSIEWNANWNTTNVDATAYIYDGTQYVTWNRLSGTGTALSGTIPPTQAFVVLANAAGASLTFPQSERINGNQPFYKEASTIDNSLTLKVSGNGYSDKIIVGFDYEASNSFDSEYDAYDYRGFEEAPQLYTIGDVEYAVNILNSEYDNLIIPVGLETGVPGTYSIRLEDLEGINGNFVIIEDVKENTFTELRLDEVLNFTVEINDNSHRFNLHFKNGVANIGNSSSSDIHIYSYDDMVYIQQPENFSGEVSIFNMMGQEIVHERATGESLMSIKITNGMGYYLVKVQNGNVLTTEKVFIK